MSSDIYKYPLDDVREIRDLRDMLRQSEELYGDNTAYLIKDPIASRQVAPRSEEALELKIDRKRPYAPVSYRQYAKDVRAFGSGLKDLGVKEKRRIAILAETC